MTRMLAFCARQWSEHCLRETLVEVSDDGDPELPTAILEASWTLVETEGFGGPAEVPVCTMCLDDDEARDLFAQRAAADDELRGRL